MFVVTFIFRPIAKFFLKNPLLGGTILLLLYLYIAYKCLLTAWEMRYAKTPSNSEVAARWQRQMTYARSLGKR
jgi:hypothetical protein